MPHLAAVLLLLAGVVTRSSELTWTGAAAFVALLTSALVTRDHASNNTNTSAMNPSMPRTIGPSRPFGESEP